MPVVEPFGDAFESKGRQRTDRKEGNEDTRYIGYDRQDGRRLQFQSRLR